MKRGVCRTFFLLLSLFFFPGVAYCQVLEKANPIVFAEGFVGGSVGINGVLGGTELNYQAGRRLISFRYAYAEDKKKIGEIILPLYEVQESAGELALLYGYRYIQNTRSLSISVGPSYHFHKERVEENGEEVVKHDEYAGVSYEMNIKWFQEKRDPFRLLALIPVSKPTAFGGSIGLKLLGSFSKHSYAGLALVYGLGYHKAY